MEMRPPPGPIASAALVMRSMSTRWSCRTSASSHAGSRSRVSESRVFFGTLAARRPLTSAIISERSTRSARISSRPVEGSIRRQSDAARREAATMSASASPLRGPSTGSKSATAPGGSRHLVLDGLDPPSVREERLGAQRDALHRDRQLAERARGAEGRLHPGSERLEERVAPPGPGLVDRLGVHDHEHAERCAADVSQGSAEVRLDPLLREPRVPREERGHVLPMHARPAADQVGAGRALEVVREERAIAVAAPHRRGADAVALAAADLAHEGAARAERSDQPVAEPPEELLGGRGVQAGEEEVGIAPELLAQDAEHLLIHRARPGVAGGRGGRARTRSWAQHQQSARQPARPRARRGAAPPWTSADTGV